MWARVFIFSLFLQAQASIISLDLCADQWVLELVPPRDIFAVTYLAQDPDISFFSEKAIGLKVHKGEIEELLDPAIKSAVAMDNLDPFIKNILEKRGVRIIVLKSPQTLEEVNEQRQFLIKELGLKEKDSNPFPSPPLSRKRAVCYGASGLSPGGKTLLGQALTKAGFENGFKNFKGWKYIDWEKILEADPAVVFLLEGPSKNRHHPFWKRFMKNRREVELPKKVTLCACYSTVNELIETMKKTHHA